MAPPGHAAATRQNRVRYLNIARFAFLSCDGPTPVDRKDGSGDDEPGCFIPVAGRVRCRLATPRAVFP